ncbi:MAG TPA: oligosaccharide flippase family protein [Candidatus Angelobacter sp.]|nr:oligosaccharide flippase family protein [Candidatus Angelobacter sp.]
MSLASSQVENIDAGHSITAVTQPARRKKWSSIVLSGSLIMLFSSTLVSSLNFFFNVAMARMLGPSEFGNVTAAVTLLMLASAVTLAFQLVCAKLVAQQDDAGARAGIYQTLRRKAWMVSLLMGAALFLAQKPFAAFLHLSQPWILGVLALGVAAYVPLGVRRGALQGTCSFNRLGGNFVVESAARFLAAVALVAAGYGVLGAVGAISASVFIACFVVPLPSQMKAQPGPVARISLHEGMQALVFFIGQVIINNIDILLVKHFFEPAQAGLYAAVALVGRVLYLAAWSVVSVMFPVSAASEQHDQNRDVVALPLLLVFGLVSVFTLVVAFLPHFIMHVIFGPRFTDGGHLLALYAAATGIYALSVVLMAHEMSRRTARTAWLQLIFSGILALAIAVFHRDLRQVIVVQVVLMTIMLLLVSISFVRRHHSEFAQEAV